MLGIRLRGEDMANWVVPEYTREEVDWAGHVLADYRRAGRATADHLVTALDIIGNWRSSHSFPLNTFQGTLRKKGRAVCGSVIVAQRIKRLSSIWSKLRRFRWLTLSEMQDIGGCRAVMDSLQSVRELVEQYQDSNLKHTLADLDDYITAPKKSGYRGVHLIYKYHSDRKQHYEGLKIEVQIRSPLQHAWATAVETVGTFTQQALKSSQGEERWQRFFALMGTAIANREKSPAVPNTPTDRRELKAELSEIAMQLDVVPRLQQYAHALRTPEYFTTQGAHFYLLTLDARAGRLTVQGFRADEMAQANERYLTVEKEITETPGADAVLVSVDSVEALRRAYPNYYADTQVFIDAVKRAMA